MSNYSNYGTAEAQQMILAIQATDASFAVGIDGRYGKRWSSTNLDVVAEGDGMALLQKRCSSGKPGRYTSVKKSYFLLVRRGETVSAIQVAATCRTPLALAAKRAGL